MSESILDQSSFMITYSGRTFTMFDPQPDQIDIGDIAHALSMLCRFTGHTSDFYSVAQHSVLTSMYVDPEYAFEGLLHDAAEAYINDLSRPIKHHPSMAGYRSLEARVDVAIRVKFGLPVRMSPEVKRVDNLLVCDEAKRFWRHTPEWVKGQPSLGLYILPWTPAQAEEAFLGHFRLCSLRQKATA